MLIIRWIISALTIVLATYIVPGVFIASFWSALWVAALLGFVNVTIKPLLIILTLPLNILTLGLFALVINAFMIMLISGLAKGFSVDGFWQALIFGVVLAILNFVFSFGKE
ncbi:MAG: phage holin family protein [Patescibacteria group bacterium]|nr:phage holin family protein [Patescibacteria group bacterium]